MSLSGKLTAVITTLCFVFSFICAPVLQATLGDTHATPMSGVAQTPELLIPLGIGSITSSKDFKSNLSVICIQDLHCNAEVQMNISKILAALDEKYALKSVYVEGGYGDIDTSWLDSLPSANIKKNVAKALVESGRLTGSEYYAITTNKAHLLKGLEDEKLHKDNIIRLGKILGQNTSFEETTKKMDDDIALLKARYLNHKNNKLNTLIKDYRDRAISAQKYYMLLKKYVDQINDHPDKYNALFKIRMANYPSTTAYLEFLDLDTHLNSPQVTRQLHNLVQELRSILPYREYSTLLSQTDNFRKTDTLYELLAQIVKEQKIDISRHYPDLDHFFTYLAKRKSVNPVLLIKEEKRLIEELRIALSSDVSEVEISFLADFYDTFKDYLFNKLSANDYEYFVSRFDKFKTIWAQYTYDNYLKELEPEFPILDTYYKVNDERTNGFIKNIIKDSSHNVIVMVTGGFHSEGLQKLLEEQKISYRTITPNVVADTANAAALYQDIIKKDAAVFSRQALSHTIYSNMRPELRVTENNELILSFGTGEYIKVDIAGKLIMGLDHAEGQKAFNAATAPPAVIEQLLIAARNGALAAPEVVMWQIEKIKVAFGLAELVPETYYTFVMMAYFMARKGWLPYEGLSWDVAESGEITQSSILSVLSDEIGDRWNKVKVNKNELAGFPPFVQRMIEKHVQRIQTASAEIPAYLRSVSSLYRLIITLNSELEYPQTRNKADFADNHQVNLNEKSKISSRIKLLSLTGFIPRLSIMLHNRWNWKYWGTDLMLSFGDKFWRKRKEAGIDQFAAYIYNLETNPFNSHNGYDAASKYGYNHYFTVMYNELLRRIYNQPMNQNDIIGVDSEIEFEARQALKPSRWRTGQIETLNPLSEDTLKGYVVNSLRSISSTMDLMDFLRSKSAGVSTISDFIKDHHDDVKGGYSLGTSQYSYEYGYYPYDYYSKLLGLTDWKTGYAWNKLTQNEDWHTSKYLRRITMRG
ncbi:MAG: hypothetical protein ABSH12_07930, partial [Endomicrobiales bacterium]